MVIITVMWICQSFSSLQGITYTAKGTDFHHAQEKAQRYCSLNSNSGIDGRDFGLNDCQELGCTMQETN